MKQFVCLNYAYISALQRILLEVSWNAFCIRKIEKFISIQDCTNTSGIELVFNLVNDSISLSQTIIVWKINGKF